MELKEYEIATNGISLHVTELGDGPGRFFLPRFSGHFLYVAQADESCRVSRLSSNCPRYARVRVQLRAIRRSFVHALHTAGDLVGLLDALNLPSAVIVDGDAGGRADSSCRVAGRDNLAGGVDLRMLSDEAFATHTLLLWSTATAVGLSQQVKLAVTLPFALTCATEFNSWFAIKASPLELKLRATGVPTSPEAMLAAPESGVGIPEPLSWMVCESP